jgi:polysaccharide chain length determinant protein (PEP-CTERM system associated)
MAENRRVSELPERVGSRHAFSEYGKLLRRRWAYLALIIPTSLLVAIYVAFVLPVSYRASGTIMLEPSSIPTEMVSSTVRRLQDVPEYAQQELELVRRRVMTPDKLLQLVKEVDPYPGSPLNPEQKAEHVVEDTSVERVDPITLKPLDQSTAFSVYYDNPNPRIAAAVTSRLVDLYLTYNRTTRVEQAEATYEFLQSQAKDLEVEMVTGEQKLAAFKAKNANSLPEMQTHNLAGVDRAQHDLEETQREVLVAEEKESQLQLQLNDLSPNLASAVNDWRTQLAKLRSDLAEAELKYTPAHPEVKRLRRAIAEMQSTGAVSMQKGAGPADNPDYLSVQSQLEATRRQLSTLRADEARERSDINRYEQGMATAPNVDREYTELQRSYDNARARYEDLQSKMKNAALARTMEVQERGEKFTLLQAPKPPRRPYYPNRIGIILLGLVIGAGVAFAFVAAADAGDPTVRGTLDLQEIIGTAAIGAIPTILNPRDVRRRRLRWGSAVVAFAVASFWVAATVLLNHH